MKEGTSDKKSAQPTIPLLIGTYTSGGSQGIYLSDFNPKTGSLSPPTLVAESENPSFLTVAEKSKNVFAVNENDPGQISMFQWEKHKKLVAREIISSEGIHPCHVSLSPDEAFLSVANYSSGSVSLYSLKTGTPSLVRIFQHAGKGANPQRQEGPHAHSSTFSPHARWLYAVDLGIDEIKLYDPHDTLVVRTAYKAKPGDGPRHLDFHPRKNQVFILNELSNTVSACEIMEDGSFRLINQVSSLPEGFTGESKGADIHVSKDGRYLYSSNRGYNSIAIYSIAENGSITLIHQESRGISTPRNFILSPSGKHLLAANQDADNVIVFAIKPDGLLSPLPHSASVDSPVCLRFFEW